MTDQLPDTLADRLARYRRTKALIALLNDRRIMPMPAATLNIAIACLIDERGRRLVVRKRSTRIFMLPGGKAEPGETPLQTLKRELHEELDLRLEADDIASFGHFCAPAANEPDHQVEADVFIGSVPNAGTPQDAPGEQGWLGFATSARGWWAPVVRRREVGTG